ncbi:hypothetical protein QBC43DRAFT_310224 [Cladorrhinum sp. PSN259]|nr:hypothetical protein QBC43DRAFT_310224 [Cladorrhinum sp. PSN259]
MADVRALLRQQRAARRIEHSLAAYSDSGKLSCATCREPIKSEALWDGHLRSAGHRQRAQAQASSTTTAPRHAGFVDQTSGGNVNGSSSTTATTGKRKHAADDEDEEMGDDDGGVADEDAARRRRKRTKQDINTHHEGGEPSRPTTTTVVVVAGGGAGGGAGGDGKSLTPPLTRRTSGTPTFGVEMQIPSRPATPGPAGKEDRSTGTPMSITPKPGTTTTNRSPLMPELAVMPSHPAKPSATTTAAAPGATAEAAAAGVDDDVWAAFEADLLQEKPKPAVPAALAALESDAVISAPVMSAAEVAAKSEEEEKQKRRALADIQIEDEKEDATRALETEFEVMEELEARARKLRERREALRLRGGSVEASAAPAPEVVGVPSGAKGQQDLGKENAPAGGMDEDEDDDDDDEDDEDDWDGFRFRA